VIFNPTAGRVGRHPGLLDRLERLPDAEVRTTTGPTDATRLARAAVEAGAGTVVVAGGDGTLHETVNGLVPDEDAVRLAVVPVGTGNDFSAALGIPRDPDRALELLRRGATRAVDLLRVRVGGRESRAVNFVLGGFGGDIGRHVTRVRKERWRRLVYLRGALASMRGLRPHVAEVTVDGEPLPRGPHLALLVANGPRLGAGIPVAPHASPADGRMDVLAIRGRSVRAVAGVLVRAVAGRHLHSPRVSVHRARRLTVRARPPMPFNADGQDLGTGDAEVEILEGALRVYAPDNPSHGETVPRS
jgi:diacylglycerol kinase (ATP)